MRLPNIMRPRLLPIILLLLLVPAAAHAQIRVTISGTSDRKFPLAVDNIEVGEGDLAGAQASIDATLKADLDILGLFSLIKREAFLEPAEAGLEHDQFKWEDWETIGASGLVKIALNTRGNNMLVADLRVYDVSGRTLLGGKSFEAAVESAQDLGDQIADEIFRLLTGEQGIFSSRIVSVQVIGGHKEIVILNPRGERVRRVTSDGNITLSPAWWPDGSTICFTSFRGGNPDLYVWRNGKAQVFSARPGVNSGAAVHPNGRQVALSLSKDNDSEIYLLDPTGNNPVRLTNSWGIDVSPEWSPDGSKIAFVSGRNGSPQIFIMDVASGQTRRLTTAGKHNVAPSWSPDGERIAFSARDDGRFDIFVVNADGSGLRRLTQSKGNDEDPSWASNGRYLVFASTRDGSRKLWFMDDEGGHQRALTKDSGYSNPDWGPARSKP